MINLDECISDKKPVTEGIGIFFSPFIGLFLFMTLGINPTSSAINFAISKHSVEELFKTKSPNSFFSGFNLKYLA